MTAGRRCGSRRHRGVQGGRRVAWLLCSRRFLLLVQIDLVSIEVYMGRRAVTRTRFVLLFPAFFPQIVSALLKDPEPFFTNARGHGRSSTPTSSKAMSADIWRIDDERCWSANRLAAFIELVDTVSRRRFSLDMLTTVADICAALR